MSRARSLRRFDAKSWRVRTGPLDGCATLHSVSATADPFAELLAELADGSRWKLARATGWDDFVDRLSRLLPDLPLRRRQGVIMLLVALTEGSLESEELADW